MASLISHSGFSRCSVCEFLEHLYSNRQPPRLNKTKAVAVPSDYGVRFDADRQSLQTAHGHAGSQGSIAGAVWGRFTEHRRREVPGSAVGSAARDLKARTSNT